MIARRMAFALGLLGAFTASQGPEFTQQYRQRLGGALDELQRIVNRFDADAQAANRNRAQALSALEANPDMLVSRQGTSMRAVVNRYDDLAAASKALAEAGPMTRVVTMARTADPEISAATWQAFEPAIPTTREGLLSMLIGFVAFWAGVLGLTGLAHRLTPRTRRTA